MGHLVLDDIQSLAIHLIRRDAGRELVVDAGRMKSAAPGVSLADCFAATLAQRLSGVVLTSDPDFQTPATLGFCRAQFFREPGSRWKALALVVSDPMDADGLRPSP